MSAVTVRRERAQGNPVAPGLGSVRWNGLALRTNSTTSSPSSTSRSRRYPRRGGVGHQYGLRRRFNSNSECPRSPLTAWAVGHKATPRYASRKERFHDWTSKGAIDAYGRDMEVARLYGIARECLAFCADFRTVTQQSCQATSATRRIP